MLVLQVYCDMETDGGGWIVIQRRKCGEIDFYRNWADYEEGFGYLDHEFWLGLANIHRLTEGGATLRIELGDHQDNTAYAEYSTFRIKDDGDDYRLVIGGYSGTAGDSMTPSNSSNNYLDRCGFSTKDNDNDGWYNNCAVNNKGAWWYNSCAWSNLNGLCHGSGSQGIVWYSWRYSWMPLKLSEMKIKL